MAEPVGRVTLEQARKDYPKAETREIEHTANSATVEFVIPDGLEPGYNFYHFFQTPEGMASVQFVLRNQSPFNTPEKFKAARAARSEAWARDVKTLVPQVRDVLSKTAIPAARKDANPEKKAGR